MYLANFRIIRTSSPRREKSHVTCDGLCESEVINGILSIPLDYVLVVVVDGDAGFSESACVLF